MKRIVITAMCTLILFGCSEKSIVKRDYVVDNAASTIEWKGSAPDHFHIGSFEVTGGFNTTGEGQIQNGEFVIPINSIQNFDLPDSIKPQLITHLLSPDFFNAVLYPEAKFKITQVQAYQGGDTSAIEGANYRIEGDFSMLGQTHPLSFAAKISNRGDTVRTEANLKIDRTKWGMNSYTDPKQPLHIFKDVNLNLEIIAVRR
jgi:polyisoprenoid-binding protein YceI